MSEKYLEISYHNLELCHYVRYQGSFDATSQMIVKPAM